MFDDEQDFTDVVEDRFPYDGPHTSESVISAGRGVSELVRYLNNATGPGNGTSSLRYAPNTYRLLAQVHTATAGLDQLLEQLGTALARHADDPTLYHDERGEVTGSAAAHQAAADLNAARQPLADAAALIGQAWQETSHLGHNIP